MYIYPDFYKKFSCIGPDCLSNCCCEGWNIPVTTEAAAYYKQAEGEFGDFIRKNILLNDQNQTTKIRLTDDRQCPFLNENKLCRIYLECGEEHMSKPCKIFPRGRLDMGGNSMRGLSLSCEEVLSLLHAQSEPICLYVEGKTEIVTDDDQYVYVLAQLAEQGMKILQDNSIPLGVGLSTALYIGMDAGKHLANRNYEAAGEAMDRFPEIQEQFQSVYTELKSATDQNETAQQLIFGITDTFCLLVNETDVIQKETYLWKMDTFSTNDLERKTFILNCYQKKTTTPENTVFMRRLAAALFQYQTMQLGTMPEASLYLESMSNFIILAEILPLTWENAPAFGERAYFSRLSRVSRLFQQSGIVRNYIGPVIQDLFKPDLYTYALAFMELF